MSDAATIIEALACGQRGCVCNHALRTGKGLVHCLVHNDPGPSLNVNEKDGVLLVNCKAGCGQQVVVTALKERNLWPERDRNEPTPIRPRGGSPSRTKTSWGLGEPVEVYDYCGPDGTLVAQKARFEQGDHKTFLWRKPGGAWSDGIKPMTVADMPLWGADLVAKAEPDATVWICEGEKAVNACRARDLLAVTFGGGAGSTDFGDAFKVLIGHPVMLWPDNDAPGRTFGGRVMAHLKEIGATSVTTVTVPVKEKGDAHDYFSEGGTVEDILARALDRPVLEFLAEDTLRVRMPTIAGVVVITCAELSKTPRSLDTLVKIQLIGPPEKDPMQCRLNLQSLSNVTELRRTLDNLYGDSIGWTEILMKAFGMIRDGFLDHDPSCDVADIETPETQQFHIERIAPSGEPTVLFGDGGSLKSYVAFAMAVAGASNEQFVGLDTMPGRWLVLDYETGPENFARRLRRIAQSYGMERMPPGLIHYWPSNGTPLPDLIDALQIKIRRDGIVGMIIDSGAPACGGEPENAEVALRYFRALSRLKITTITICHITKSNAASPNSSYNTMYPFGSKFWHNAPRRTWYVERDAREEADDIELGLLNRKVNDGRLLRPVGIQVRFDGTEGPVYFDNAGAVHASMDSKRNPVDRIWDVLTQPMTQIEIAEVLGLKPDNVRYHLQSNPKKFVRVETSKGGPGQVTRWGRLATPQQQASGGALPW